MLANVPWSVVFAYAGDALWALPVATFLVSLWPALQARAVSEEGALILFGVRAITAPLLALLHLRGLRDTLQP